MANYDHFWPNDQIDHSFAKNKFLQKKFAKMQNKFLTKNLFFFAKKLAHGQLGYPAPTSHFCPACSAPSGQVAWKVASEGRNTHFAHFLSMQDRSFFDFSKEKIKRKSLRQTTIAP